MAHSKDNKLFSLRMFLTQTFFRIVLTEVVLGVVILIKNHTEKTWLFSALDRPKFCINAVLESQSGQKCWFSIAFEKRHNFK